MGILNRTPDGDERDFPSDFNYEGLALTDFQKQLAQNEGMEREEIEEILEDLESLKTCEGTPLDSLGTKLFAGREFTLDEECGAPTPDNITLSLALSHIRLGQVALDTGVVENLFANAMLSGRFARQFNEPLQQTWVEDLFFRLKNRAKPAEEELLINLGAELLTNAHRTKEHSELARSENLEIFETLTELVGKRSGELGEKAVPIFAPFLKSLVHYRWTGTEALSRFHHALGKVSWATLDKKAAQNFLLAGLVLECQWLDLHRQERKFLKPSGSRDIPTEERLSREECKALPAEETPRKLFWGRFKNCDLSKEEKLGVITRLQTVLKIELPRMFKRYQQDLRALPSAPSQGGQNSAPQDSSAKKILPSQPVSEIEGPAPLG